jgi:hypothetical protein
MSDLRRCRTCHEEKEPSLYYADGRRAGGVHSECKACHDARKLRNQRRLYQTNPMARAKKLWRNRRIKGLLRHGFWIVEPKPEPQPLSRCAACLCGHGLADHLLDVVCMHDDCSCRRFVARVVTSGGQPVYDTATPTRPIAAEVHLDFDGVELGQLRQRLERRPSRALEVA